MTTKTLAIVLIVAALFGVGVIAMHGKGHKALAKWLPSMHGGTGPKYAVCDDAGPRLVAMDALLAGKPED